MADDGITSIYTVASTFLLYSNLELELYPESETTLLLHPHLPSFTHSGTDLVLVDLNQTHLSEVGKITIRGP